ncbi:MAG TPA: alpha/beta-hydrolase N-terminal domain-containing protein, partial [Ornithinibacter sp.]|nr:alpha/beta-hydrolase N-terminal domain-containing protein [Ornithinibacter sp.]
MTAALVENAAHRVRQSPLVPGLGRPERPFDRVLSGVGVTTATWFFAASLVPSLLPRAAWLQGLVSGVTVAVGYGLGAGAAALWRYLGIPGLRGRARTVALWVLVGVGAWGAVWNGWRLVGWQNEIREMFGMPHTSPLIWPVVVAVTVVVAIALLLAGRG